MPIFPSLKRISKEDFPDAPDWFTQFLLQLNPFLGDVTQALNGNLAPQNLKRQIIQRTLDTQPAVSDTFTNGKIQIKSTIGKPNEVRIGQALPQTAGDALSAAPGLAWSYTQDGNVRVDNIFGLNASKRYLITFVLE